MPQDRIEQLIASVPDPFSVRNSLHVLRQQAPAGFEQIVNSPAALRCAVNLFAFSRFLSESVVRDPERLLFVANSGAFYRVLSVEDYRERLSNFLGDHAAPIDFARFRRRHLLRIPLRAILVVPTLAAVPQKLSNLAD